MNWLDRFTELALSNLRAFLETDWALVEFKQEYFAVRAAVVLLAALFIKILWPYFPGRIRKEESSLEHSGYPVTAKDKPGLLSIVLGSIPLGLAISAVIFLLVAIADPYTTSSRQTQFTEAREIGYLKDTSVSMGWRFKNSKRARGEIVQDFLLQLVADRKDKKDRAAYMIFASNPWLIADFTNDNDSLLFSIYNGPVVTADPSAPQLFPDIFLLKEFTKIPFGGGTNLFLGLEAMVKLFETRGDKKISEATARNPSIKRRSVVIITDGASEEDPEPQFKELKKRAVVPYLIFIDPDQDVEKKLWGEDSPRTKLPEQLLRQVRAYGGDYWLATDQYALAKIKQRLDALHGSITRAEDHVTENHIYRLPLMVSLILFALAILARLILWFVNRTV